MRIAMDHPPGLDLDRIVALKVFGIDLPKDDRWRCHDDSWTYLGLGESLDARRWTNYSLPRYSESILAAWEVVEKTKILDRFCLAQYDPEFEADWGWAVYADDWIVFAAGKTAPLAICLAALKAMETG